jgi:hypothetical protein
MLVRDPEVTPVINQPAAGLQTLQVLLPNVGPHAVKYQVSAFAAVHLPDP